MASRRVTTSAAASPVAAYDCVGYLRVSTERQAGEVYTSLADQRAAIEQLAARHGRTVGRWYEDDGVSGGTADRPAFVAMLADCLGTRPARRPGLVLALNDSRWGRFPDPDEAAALRFQFSRAGWSVRFCESDETEDPTFRSVIRALGSAQASEYRRAIQRNAKRGAKGTAEQGFWTTRAPYGYRRKVVHPAGRERVLESGVRKASDEKVRLTPGPEAEQAFVRWCFKTYASGTGAGLTLGELARASVAHCPGRTWTIPGLRELLKNPAYVGDVVSGRRPGDKDERALHAVRPAAAWYGRRDAHPALVTRPLFDAVQARLGENAARPRAARASYPLSGLVTCAVCDGPLVSGGVNQAGARSYRCARAMTDRRTPGRTTACPGSLGNISQWKLETAVVDLVAREVSRPVVRRRLAAAIDAQLAAMRSTSLPAVAAERAARAVAQLEAQRDRLVALMAAGTVTHDECAATLAILRRDLAAAAAERDRTAAVVAVSAHAADRLVHERDELLAAARDFRGIVADATGPELRSLLRPWIAGATFHKISRELTIMIRHIPQQPGSLAAAAYSVNPDGMPEHATQNHGLTSGKAPAGVTIRRASLAGVRKPRTRRTTTGGR